MKKSMCIVTLTAWKYDTASFKQIFVGIFFYEQVNEIVVG